MNNQKMQYRIIKTTNLNTMEELTQEMAQEGWQPAGPVTEVSNVGDDGIHFYHEMVRLVTDNLAQQREEMQIAADRQAFMKKLDNMDSKVKDLLELNGIVLMFVDGKLYTQVGEKITEGIQPQEVLKLLKASKHYPIDMKDEVVLNAIEGVI